MKRQISLMILITTGWPVITYATVTTDDLKSAKTVVEDFQRLPTSVMLCDSGEPDGARGEAVFENKKSRAATYLVPTYQRFFSRDFYQLFMWVQCLVPKNPPQRTGRALYDQGITDTNYYRDFRFGITPDEASEPPRKIRVATVQSKGDSKISVKVNFEYGSWKLWNVYTLVKEDGYWKIDDMAPKEESTSMEVLHWGSKELKKEFQALFKYSDELYRHGGISALKK